MTTIKVYYLTNRNETGSDEQPAFGDDFHQKGPHYLRLGSAEVAPPAEPTAEYRVRSVYLAPEAIAAEDGTPRRKPKLGSREIFDELRQTMRHGAADLIVLIHGYAADFRTALERAAELKHRYAQVGKPLEAIVFCWPADGTMIPLLSYYRDRDDAKGSGIAIARAFLKLLSYFGELGPRRFCRRGLHLVAHSMGNYALRHALQAAISQGPGKVLPRIFQNIFLMAADEDNDALELDHKLARLPELAEAVHVYYSASDQALVISDRTKTNPDRLGSTGPRTLSNLPHKISLIDCRWVDDTRPIEHARHQYYRRRQEVIEDVQAVLRGLPPDQIGNRDYIADKRCFRIRAT
ncbi:MAG: alpha/beta hydrolase [Alphaproteobacteria bacterium]|nr:alpha/beta hydrolase [Alphaproteobacteria bacterium]